MCYICAFPTPAASTESAPSLPPAPSQVEDFIRTQLGFSAACCRDACRFSYMLCGCEGGVLTLAMRFIGDPSVFSVLLQQMGLACGVLGVQPLPRRVLRGAACDGPLMS